VIDQELPIATKLVLRQSKYKYLLARRLILTFKAISQNETEFIVNRIIASYNGSCKFTWSNVEDKKSFLSVLSVVTQYNY
jgi:hypothetical protein